MLEAAAHHPDPHHPSNWGIASKGPGEEGRSLHELTAEHRAFLVWLTDLLARGGWTSLGQAARKVTALDAQGVRIERPQLGVDKSTLSRWLAGQNLPGERSLRTVLDRLDERIRQRRQETADSSVGFPELIARSDVEKGLRFLRAAGAAITRAQATWELSWDCYDRLYARWEMAAESAEEARLKTQDHTSALLARTQIAENELSRAEAELRILRAQIPTQISQPKHRHRTEEEALGRSKRAASGFPADESIIPPMAYGPGIDTPNMQVPEAAEEEHHQTISHSHVCEEERKSRHGESIEAPSKASCIAGKAASAAAGTAVYAVVVGIAALGPIVLMSGAWAFWFGIPWGEVRNQPEKSFLIVLFVMLCLLASCVLMATPSLLVSEGGLALSGGCILSALGVAGSYLLLSNYPYVMEWLPKAVGAY
ncbi:hypothetical protein ACWD3Z_34105 [Streptomyces sp. NPDC002740]